MKAHAKRVVRFIRKHLDTSLDFRGAEVGVFRGETSEGLLETFPNLHLVLIDSWPGESCEMRTSCSSEQAERETRERMIPFAGRATIRKEDSVEVAKRFPDEHFDFAFIDANHYYEGVSQDVRTWYPKVKAGGLLIGHDYGGRMDQIGKFGVQKAVDEFCEENGLEVMVASYMVWAIKKPKA